MVEANLLVAFNASVAEPPLKVVVRVLATMLSVSRTAPASTLSAPEPVRARTKSSLPIAASTRPASIVATPIVLVPPDTDFTRVPFTVRLEVVAVPRAMPTAPSMVHLAPATIVSDAAFAVVSPSFSAPVWMTAPASARLAPPAMSPAPASVQVLALSRT